MGAPLPANEAARPEALRQREILEAVLERITDAFVALDTDWRYIYVNEKAARIFDRRREDLIGKHIWTEFPEGVGRKTAEAGPPDALTPRQREVLKLIAEGRSTKEIAYALQLSVKTVETHRAQVMERLGIRDVAGLVRYTIRAGIVSAE